MLATRARTFLLRARSSRAFSRSPRSLLAPSLPLLNKAARQNSKRKHALPARMQPPPPPSPSASEAASNALQRTSAQDENNLMATVKIPEDRYSVLSSDHPAVSILSNSSIVIQRQMEMMNVFLGFEQANKYVIMDPEGNTIGYLAEQEHGIANMMARQLAKTHRSFTTHVFDKSEKEVLRFHRPFSWISSRIRVYDAASKGASEFTTSSALQGSSVGAITNQTSASVSPLPYSEMRIIGEAQQQWAPLRRKYNLFLHRDLPTSPATPNTPRLTSGDLPLSNSTALQVAEAGKEHIGFSQFAYVDEPFLSWDFSLKSEDERLVGSVNRNFSGFAREIFTDTGVYALRMDAAAVGLGGVEGRDASGEPAVGMTLDQRAVMLATAVSIDFDYFSRHSSAVGGGGMGFFPLWFPGMGGGGGAAAAEGGAAAGGVAEAGTGAVAGAAERGVGGAAAGVGTMAGYEAMQSGREDGGMEQDSQSPQTPYGDGQGQDPWGDGGAQNDGGWWNEGSGGDSQSGGGGQGGGGQPPSGGSGGDGDGGDFFSDLF